jgi:hypothetical protein
MTMSPQSTKGHLHFSSGKERPTCLTPMMVTQLYNFNAVITYFTYSEVFDYAHLAL